MQIRVIQWDFDAWEDYLYWQGQDKKILKRINQLVKDICRNPFEGIGKPEPLKGNLTGFWSRRVDEEHRLVYAVEDSAVVVISCRGHYDD
ncbi:Txe/YoeB family addiction module toxin [Lachnotalea sp. AF33-28]|uniref:Txe/YoeB family addiction module toxin n=1 Tax=Lachnotalea sp. AF33-28 TaxID=2292046 RepID=UPI000E491A99|nr:Txe/YoeB family addiction module toxin [Lachnotalea sp. AF33-28]RHP35516.1 Txe/YoeB family addiction module toxin [Lachnotalea sp. AF33-28]